MLLRYSIWIHDTAGHLHVYACLGSVSNVMGNALQQEAHLGVVRVICRNSPDKAERVEHRYQYASYLVDCAL